MRATLFVLLFVGVALGDIYMHCMRGSNGRLNEDGNNRNNANRLMDTQNNAEGGYCINAEDANAQEYFYEKSLMQLEWTAQHGCGNGRNRCNFVIQYMCADNNNPETALRDGDGSTTDTIPDDPDTFKTIGTTGRYKYGMHESYAYYQDCKTRFRNFGLWTADRNLGGNDARFTRQNQGGNRFGFECTEERDYYPYWAPTPWIDIAVLTDDLSLCPYYKAESQNVKGGGVCFLPGESTPNKMLDGYSCAKIQGARWVLQPNGRPAPECLEAPQMRENQLGNAGNLNHVVRAANYNWTLPSGKDEPCVGKNCSCVLRIRYNISTDDIVGFGEGMTDYTKNTNNGNVKKVEGILQNDNPTVSVEAVNLTLALNLAQHGRTFQDRSHSFRIVNRPSGVSPNARIFNLNVRGKRGNIVQTYPSVEYDFVPNNLEVRKGDYIHFQWIGCDHNPAGNAGEGKDKTDRTNIVEIPSDGSSTFNYKGFMNSKSSPLFDSPSLRNHFAGLAQENCDPTATGNNADNNCKKLNNAPAYFDGGLYLQNTTGDKYFMSTRNNNFSNRDQKAVITVTNFLPTWGVAIVIVGSVFFAGSAAVAGGVFYAKMHPTSQLANVFQNMQ